MATPTRTQITRARLHQAHNNLPGVQQSRSGRRSMPDATPTRITAPSSGGVSNPPIFRRVLSRGRPRGLLTPRCLCRKPLPKRWDDPRAVCACVTAAYSLQIAHETRCTFDTDSAARTRSHRPSRDQRRAVLGLVKARRFRSAPPRGPPGLDDACAQLESSTCVMAEEGRRIVSY